MGPTPPALPPVTAQFSSTLQRAGAQSPASQSTYQFSRSADGKTRVDSGNTSVICNPATAQTIILDHAKNTATIKPAPTPAPPNPGMPQMPGLSPPSLPGQPQVPGVKVEDLGKSVLQGFQVEGKRFAMPQLAPPAPPQVPGMPSAAPKLPQIPGMPAAPKLPQIPGMPSALPKLPQVPGMPAVPKAPQMPGTPPAPPAPQPPATTEVWNSPSMGVPILAKMSGSFGQLTQVCHSAVPGEPHPSNFQIPQGYQVIGTVTPTRQNS